jgi:hypothetical protein
MPRIGPRAVRAWGRFRQAAVSSFAFVEAAGPLYGAKLVRDALGLNGGRRESGAPPRSTVEALDAGTKAETAATVLKAMSLTRTMRGRSSCLGPWRAGDQQPA